MSAGGVTLYGEHDEWLQQLALDVERHITRDQDMQLGAADQQNIDVGVSKLAEWRAERKLVQLLDPRAMWWFWLPWYVTGSKSYLEPQLDHNPRRMPEGMIECGELLEDGSFCSYSGTPAVVGKHKLDAHGICNNIKTILMTSECLSWVWGAISHGPIRKGACTPCME